MQIAAIIFIILSGAIIIAMFVRSRAREGIRPLEITDADKAQLQEMRREFGIRRVAGGLFGTLGGLCLAGAITLPFDAELSRVDWRSFTILIVLGVFLILCAVPLLKGPR